ncbi:MAG: PspC domain-containing protein [Acidimicrobiales bacterium]|jgi:phage shock protein PspC (stress-responsive transcriptional regulator)
MDETTNQNNPAEPRPLRRTREGSMLAGVAVGLSEYFEVDVTFVRIGLVALSLLGGAGIPLYIAAWLLIPEEGSDLAIAGEILSHSWRN